MLNKRTIQSFVTCPRLGFFEAGGEGRERGSEALGPATRLQMAQGRLIGERAGREFLGAMRIEAGDLGTAARETREAVKSGARVLLEAAFVHGPLATRPDILARERGDRWRLWEVKAGTELRQEYLLDIAFQVFVLEGAGMRVRSGLFLVDREASFESATIFRRVDCDEEARALLGTVEEAVSRLDALLQDNDPPPATLERRCRECDYRGSCWPDLPSPSVLELYQGRGGWRNVQALLDAGITDLAEVPAGASLTRMQKRQLEAVRSGETVADQKARDELRRGVRHPLHFLDFEAARFPIPELPGQHPYDLIPFQWSCHVEETPGSPLLHREFLRDTPGDPRRELAEALLACVGPEGNVIVYSGFEQEVIRSLAASFEDLARGLENMEKRIIDLLPIVRSHYYHPGFGGSFSIKSVLPVLVPGLSYDGMAVGDGMEAVWAYHRLVHEGLAGDERSRLTADLRAYCEQDSFALARIYHVLVDGAGEAKEGRKRPGERA